MALETTTFKTISVNFKSPSHDSSPYSSLTEHERATYAFHQWLDGCKKKVYHDNQNNIIKIEYIFPDEKIIKVFM